MQRARAQLDRAHRLQRTKKFRAIITDEVWTAILADVVSKELEWILHALPPTVHLKADTSQGGKIILEGRCDAIRAVHASIRGTAFLHGGKVILPRTSQVAE